MRRQVLTAISIAVIVGFNWFLSLGLVRDEDSEPSIVLVYVFAIIMVRNSARHRMLVFPCACVRMLVRAFSFFFSIF